MSIELKQKVLDAVEKYGRLSGEELVYTLNVEFKVPNVVIATMLGEVLTTLHENSQVKFEFNFSPNTGIVKGGPFRPWFFIKRTI